MYNISENESYQSIKRFRNTEDMPNYSRYNTFNDSKKASDVKDFITSIESRLKGKSFIPSTWVQPDRASGRPLNTRQIFNIVASGLTVIYVEDRVMKKNEAVSVNTNYIKHFADIMTIGIYVSFHYFYVLINNLILYWIFRCLNNLMNFTPNLIIFQQFINFVKQVPEFVTLDQNDQVALIKAASPEAIIIKVSSHSINSFETPPKLHRRHVTQRVMINSSTEVI